MVSHTEQVPGSDPKEAALDENVIIFQDMLHITRVIDHDAWW